MIFFVLHVLITAFVEVAAKCSVMCSFVPPVTIYCEKFAVLKADNH